MRQREHQQEEDPRGWTGPDQAAPASEPRAFGRRGGVALLQTQLPQQRGEEELQAQPRLGLTGVAGVVLETVGEHQPHVGDELP